MKCSCFSSYRCLPAPRLDAYDVYIIPLSLSVQASGKIDAASAGEGRGVERTDLEQHLSPEEFKQVLGVEKDEWAKLAKWKRVQKKKSVGLF